MTEFAYQELLPLSDDTTPYRCLTSDHVSTARFEGQAMVKVEDAGLTLLAREAMRDIAHYLRPAHLAQLRKILDDPEASQNDKFVALDLLEEREHRRRRRAADVSGHRHRDRDGQEGPAGVDAGRRRSRARARHLRDVRRAQPALLAARAAQHVRGEEHRHELAGADRALRGAGRGLQVPVHGQGRRLGQQELTCIKRRRRC